MPDIAGTEAMSERARPTPADELRSRVRLVEEGREKEKPIRKAPWVRDPHFHRLAHEMQWIEALAEGREKLAVVGDLCDDGEPKLGDGDAISTGEYVGSHNLIGGLAARQANLSIWARRCLRIIGEEAEKLDAE